MSTTTRYEVSEFEGGVLIHEQETDTRVLSPCWQARGLAYFLTRGAEQAAEHGWRINPARYGMPGERKLTPAQAFALAACVFTVACQIGAEAEGRVGLTPPDDGVAVRIADEDAVADVVV